MERRFDLSSLRMLWLDQSSWVSSITDNRKLLFNLQKIYVTKGQTSIHVYSDNGTNPGGVSNTLHNIYWKNRKNSSSERNLMDFEPPLKFPGRADGESDWLELPKEF